MQGVFMMSTVSPCFVISKCHIVDEGSLRTTAASVEQQELELPLQSLSKSPTVQIRYLWSAPTQHTGLVLLGHLSWLTAAAVALMARARTAKTLVNCILSVGGFLGLGFAVLFGAG
jgi:hypothetical protein